jgi:murein DD-endopeptidase MepM/ murein hydrolase activator NlpD
MRMNGRARAARILKKAGHYASIAVIVGLVGASAYALRNRPPRLPDGRPAAPSAGAQTAGPTPPAAPAAARTDERYVYPVSGGQVINAYSATRPVWSKTLFEWHVHKGVDIAAPAGEVVCAVAAGTVARAGKDPLLGYFIEIAHARGLTTRYASLLTQGVVKVGDAVAAGQVIGAVGRSAPSERADEAHVHFEAYTGGAWTELPLSDGPTDEP